MVALAPWSINILPPEGVAPFTRADAPNGTSHRMYPEEVSSLFSSQFFYRGNASRLVAPVEQVFTGYLVFQSPV